MLVSIVTPSFNQSKYLPDLIRSVQAQSYRPIEHILIDGASTDETIAILRAYEKDSHGISVSWQSEPDRGQAHAVNKGFEQAKGEIIGWINSDDVYFHKGVIERVVREFQAHPEVDVIHGNVVKITADNLISLIWCIPEFNYERMFVDGKVSQPTTFFRRKVIEENKLRENVLALDFEFWLRLGQKYRFMHIDDVLAGDRNQPERISQTKSVELRASHIALQQEYLPQIPKSRLFLYKVSSLPQRAFYRLIGLIAYLKIDKKRDYFAFNIRFDNTGAFIKRQLSSRIGSSFDEQ
jgi:glycosyltransferase involved in cell wall biosynthesis